MMRRIDSIISAKLDEKFGKGNYVYGSLRGPEQQLSDFGYAIVYNFGMKYIIKIEGDTLMLKPAFEHVVKCAIFSNLQEFNNLVGRAVMGNWKWTDMNPINAMIRTDYAVFRLTKSRRLSWPVGTYKVFRKEDALVIELQGIPEFIQLSEYEQKSCSQLIY